MVWVEQPVGTGFSQGTQTATNEAEVAAQFLGFFKNFVDTFAMEGFTIYITGESYAGYYVPYIADGKHSWRDTLSRLAPTCELLITLTCALGHPFRDRLAGVERRLR